MDLLSGLAGLIILVLDIWAILHVFRSSVTMGMKIVWTLLIIILPVIGLIIWALAGPRAGTTSARS